MKTCTVCKQEKSLDCFYKQKDGKLGVTSRCKPCVLASNKKWSEKNESKCKQGIRNWQLKNKEKCLEATKQWRKRNLAYDAFRARTYRARKMNQCPPWADLEKIKEIYLTCPEGYHVDHIIPLKGILASGLHVESNLQHLPAKENLQKRNLYGW